MITMNTEYHTIDGATFKATDPTDLMTQMRLDSFNPEADLPSYCRATARASKLQTGKPAPDPMPSSKLGIFRMDLPAPSQKP